MDTVANWVRMPRTAVKLTARSMAVSIDASATRAYNTPRAVVMANAARWDHVPRSDRAQTRTSMASSQAPQKSAPLTCHGHTRPVVHLEHSEKQDDGSYLLLSSCKDGNPMYVASLTHRLRDWLGDWIGTFLGACVPLTQVTRAQSGAPSSLEEMRRVLSLGAPIFPQKCGIRTRANVYRPSRTTTLCEALP